MLSLPQIEDRFSLTEEIISTSKPVKKGAIEKSTRLPVIQWEFPVTENREATRKQLEKSSRLRHMSINKVLAYCIDPSIDQAIMITERLDSDLLTQAKRKLHFEKSWSEAEVVLMQGKLIAALSFAQGKGMHHGDICPSSVFYNESPLTVKLANFTAQIRTEMNDKSVGHCGQINQYLSPEQKAILKSEQWVPYDPYKSDVFSLGMTLLFASTLELSSHEAPDLGEFLEEVIGKLSFSAKFCNVLRTMLALNPANRPNSRELADLYMKNWPENQHLFLEPVTCSL